ncbi:MAG: NAD(P)-dependent oxidoreductase [Actinobacteria bacterium]|nr:NAD(P)-dependent oxidoreductase [Actinomycetota bacterium]MBW3641717.1 NAD(P)-dependent oxidoreductase [Actinomycetota bacterium]
MSTVLVTGGAGFFGDILKRRLLADGFDCVSIDLQPELLSHPRLTSVRGDIRDGVLVDKLFSEHRFDAVFHCAAILAHAVKDKDFLWSSNVDGTEVLARNAAAHDVGKFVFISSNCLWGESFGRPVTEDDPPAPVEIYGRSKWEGEKVLGRFTDQLDIVVLRSPTIVDAGRLGLLAILFDFIREGRKVWVVGKGDNRYQFVYALDLADACVRALDAPRSTRYNVGSDDVKTLAEVYQYVIDQAGTGARVASLPKAPTLAGMRLAGALRISPLGPYHWRMIAENFTFDTSRIKDELGWRPTLTNEEMLAEAYKSYERDYDEIRQRRDVSAHRQPAKMGAIRVLKWLS